MSLLRLVLVAVPAVLLLGTLSGALSGSGEENAWFAALDKPDFMPPGWLFGLAWTILYVLLGLALALLLHARGAPRRGRVIALFAVQLALNFAWSPLFFAWHEVAAALTLLAGIVVVNAALIPLAWRIRPLAALLLVPYLAWLLFATALNFELLRLNPDAGTVAPAASGTDILL
jgi:tryptophan-rich sensory protein